MQNTKPKWGLSRVALLLGTSRWQPPIAVSKVRENCSGRGCIRWQLEQQSSATPHEEKAELVIFTPSYTSPFGKKAVSCPFPYSFWQIVIVAIHLTKLSAAAPIWGCSLLLISVKKRTRQWKKNPKQLDYLSFHRNSLKFLSLLIKIPYYFRWKQLDLSNNESGIGNRLPSRNWLMLLTYQLINYHYMRGPTEFFYMIKLVYILIFSPYNIRLKVVHF